MKVIIIEDEHFAAEGLKGLLARYDPGIEVVFIADSVKKSVGWFKTHPSPDLAIMDIQLADGISFEIFEMTDVQCPVIFTTAYNEYAIRAFKVNSVDYLLKPIDFEELARAIDKFKKITLRQSFNPGEANMVFDKVLMMLSGKYKNRFVIKVGDHIKSIQTRDILYFYSLDKASYLVTKDNFHYTVDFSLDYLISILNPADYFRISRKFILGREAIIDIISYSGSRLKIKVKHGKNEDVIVSRDRVQEFREWLD